MSSCPMAKYQSTMLSMGMVMEVAIGTAEAMVIVAVELEWQTL